MGSINAVAPVSAGGSFATSQLFMWHITEVSLVSTAVVGACVSLAVAFVIMALFTANIIVSLIALLTIVGIVFALASFMVVAGWTIGIIESVAFTIIVGLSVDYTVHIGVAYIHFSRNSYLAGRTRREIVQHAMAEIGTSVFGGAVTTASSVLALFFCTITFFKTVRLCLSKCSKCVLEVFVCSLDSLSLSIFYSRWCRHSPCSSLFCFSGVRTRARLASSLFPDAPSRSPWISRNYEIFVTKAPRRASLVNIQLFSSKLADLRSWGASHRGCEPRYWKRRDFPWQFLCQ